MKTTHTIVIDFTFDDLRESLKQYQLDLLSDIVVDVKQKNRGLKPPLVAKLMMACSDGFASEEFQKLIEEHPVPFVTACGDIDLKRCVEEHPQIFIDPNILDGNKPLLVRVEGTYLNMERLTSNI